MAGYHVYRADSGEGPFTRLTDEPHRSRIYHDDQGPFTSTQYYHVTAVDYRIPANESPQSNPAEAEPVASVGPDMFLID